MKGKYLIGIDLGTTNCTVAYAHIDDAEHQIHPFPIPQIVAAGREEASALLPSFLYFPLKEELKANQTALSWDASRTHCIGTFARDRGGEVPARLISSAKSWLCSSGVDRREKILPLSGEGETPKLSPLEACAEQLRHIREAWDRQMPKAPFVSQKIYITVPASFDPSARQLVQEAASLAGFPDAVLLEEPQAAFYAWIHSHSNSWRDILRVNDCVLVVDIGGGTTDFSLIAVKDHGGDLALERIAVGDHLLLGGDNIDLALAHLAKSKLEEAGQTVDDWQMQGLIHAARKAKEELFSEKPPKKASLSVMGRGRKLVGGMLTAEIALDEVQKLILEGFFPLVAKEEHSSPENRTGLQQIGLPYAQDPRVSCQLAKFLSMTGEGAEKDADEHFIIPTAILFNGGTTKSAALRSRLLDILNQWAKKLGKNPVQVLPGSDYDFAVSRGAVYYGLASLGKGIRIKSGTNRSYFVGIEDAAPAIPGMARPMKAICIAPFGMEEGSENDLPNQEFALIIGQQATFRFFSHATPKLPGGPEPVVGTVIKNWKQELTELPPMEVKLVKEENDGKIVRVKLKSRMTELGMLELWCEAPDARQWKLEFSAR